MSRDDFGLPPGTREREEVERWGGMVRDALDRHAAALTRSADASDRYAGRLVWATWALVLATAVLVVVTLIRG